MSRALLILTSLAATVFAAGCGGESESVTVTVTTRQQVTVDRTTTVTKTATVTKTKTTTVARAQAPSPRGGNRELQFRGNGDQTLPPIRVRRGGSTVRWTTGGSVFAVFGPGGSIVDSINSGASKRHAGSTYLRPGSYVLQVIANGTWSIRAPNAARE